MSEAAYEHDDPVSTEEPPAPVVAKADSPTAEPKVTPTAAAEPTVEPAAEPPVEPADPRAPTPAAALPKAVNPRGTPRAAKRVPGLTGRGVCVLITAVTFIGGLVDIAVSGHRSHLFGVLFVITSALGAFAVRKRDLRVAMIAPPLLYCVLIFVMSLIDQSGLTGGLLTREGFYLGNAFVTGAPSIWIGSLSAAAIGWYRLRQVGRR